MWMGAGVMKEKSEKRRHTQLCAKARLFDLAREGGAVIDVCIFREFSIFHKKNADELHVGR